jgi:exosortase
MKTGVPTAANGLAWAAGVALVWLWTWKHLSLEWRLNEDYSFGFAVPLLAAALAWQRLSETPATSAPIAHQKTSPAGDWQWRLLLIPAALLYLPGELLRLQDPTWRFSGWLMVFAATLALVAWLGSAGGMPLVRLLALPVLFNWFALPWPSAIETPVTLRLLAVATGVSVDALNWAGIPALQHGNLIELKSGVVGVDRACSGIQSLQAGLMFSVFAGEWFRLSFPRRLVLVALGVAFAVGINITRVLLLARYMHLEGGAALDAYHDRVGAAATTLLVLALTASGWLLRRRIKTPARPSPAAWPSWQLPGNAGYAALALAILVPLSSAAWMSQGGSATTQDQPLWQLRAERLPPGWRATADVFSDAELKLLRFSQGEGFHVRRPSGVRAYMVHLFWLPNATVPSEAYSHRPDICLPGAGWRQVGTPERLDLTLAGRALPGAVFRFQYESLERTVFQAVWYGGEAKPPTGPVNSIGDRFQRLALLWREPGRRNHEILAVYVDGQIPSADRTRVFEELLTPLLRPAVVK